MGARDPADRQLGEGYKYLSLGITFAGAIVMFLGAGLVLDHWLGTGPWLTVIGALGGAALAFYWVYLKLQADESAYRREHPHKYDRP